MSASEPKKPVVGAIGWHDLTVPNAEQVRDFYTAVCGWKAVPLDMGGFSDFVMKDSFGTTAAGICHARGANADVPAQWLVYVTVADLDKSVAECTRLGGSLAVPIRSIDGGRMCVIRDPAGAVMALHEPRPSA